MKSLSLDFCKFINESSSSFHAAEEIKRRLLESGFTRLREHEKWSLQPEKKYFLIKDDSLVVAFTTPKQKPLRSKIIATHLDSPCFKIKPHPTTLQGSLGLFNVEIYGAPLLHSWLDRDLTISGRVFFEDASGNLQNQIITLPFSCVMTNLAVHLDRSIAEKGVHIHKQDHIKAVYTLNAENQSFDAFLTEHLQAKKILSFDLFLTPKQSPSFVGMNEEICLSYRLDNLSSVFPALKALQESDISKDSLHISFFWDHEEIGSATATGADSNVAYHLMQRILMNLGVSQEEIFQNLSRSVCLSVDVAHGFHPNFAEKFDSQNSTYLDRGVVIKFNANQKYATSATNAAHLLALAQKHQIPTQLFAARSDIPSGSTVGSMMAAMTGISTIDLGIAIWAMHSARESMAIGDLKSLYDLLSFTLKDEFLHE